MAPKPKIAFLYSEVAGYFLSCVKELAKNAEVLIVRWPVNTEAPFKLSNIDGVEIICKTDYSKQDLMNVLHSFEPTTVVCSGWMDKDYLKIVRSFKKKVPTVLTLDNHWNGSLKQRLAALLSPFLLKNKFTHAWVPGSPQVKFAKALGFNNIITGFYCADVCLHSQNFNAAVVPKTNRFLYVGRYVKHKSIFEMWKAFISLVESGDADGWEMICAGTGEEFVNKIEHNRIQHLGFLQPADLKVVMDANPIYILPSSFEPWGVSVQEFAIAGCPLIISDRVGAAEMFLEDNKNGFLVEPTVDSIKAGMLKMIKINQSRFNEMRQQSHEKGMSYTPSDWAKKILAVKL